MVEEGQRSAPDPDDRRCHEREPASRAQDRSTTVIATTSNHSCSRPGGPRRSAARCRPHSPQRRRRPGRRGPRSRRTARLAPSGQRTAGGRGTRRTKVGVADSEDASGSVDVAAMLDGYGQHERPSFVYPVDHPELPAPRGVQAAERGAQRFPAVRVGSMVEPGRSPRSASYESRSRRQAAASGSVHVAATLHSHDQHERNLVRQRPGPGGPGRGTPGRRARRAGPPSDREPEHRRARPPPAAAPPR